MPLPSVSILPEPPVSSSPPAERPPHPLRRLLRYAGSHRRAVWLAAICSILNKLFDLAPPGLIGAAVDVVVRREDSVLAQMGIPNVRDQLIVLGVVTLVIWGLESLFEYLHGVLWRNLAQQVEHELRIDTFRRVTTDSPGSSLPPGPLILPAPSPRFLRISRISPSRTTKTSVARWTGVQSRHSFSAAVAGPANGRSAVIDSPLAPDSATIPA